MISRFLLLFVALTVGALMLDLMAFADEVAGKVATFINGIPGFPVEGEIHTCSTPSKISIFVYFHH